MGVAVLRVSFTCAGGWHLYVRDASLTDAAYVEAANGGYAPSSQVDIPLPATTYWATTLLAKLVAGDGTATIEVGT